MLNIYTGKIVFEAFATDTIITVVVPDAIATNHPCLIYWQWATTTAGTRNENNAYNAQFTAVTQSSVEVREPTPRDPFYWFTWDVASNVLQLMNKYNTVCGDPIQLSLVYPVCVVCV